MGNTRTVLDAHGHPDRGRKQYVGWDEPAFGKKHDADLAQATAAGVSVKQYIEAVEA